MAEVPSGPVLDANAPSDLIRGDTPLSLAHQSHSHKPFQQRQVGIVERVPVVTLKCILHLPHSKIWHGLPVFPRVLMLYTLSEVAGETTYPFGPAHLSQIAQGPTFGSEDLGD